MRIPVRPVTRYRRPDWVYLVYYPDTSNPLVGVPFKVAHIPLRSFTGFRGRDIAHLVVRLYLCREKITLLGSRQYNTPAGVRGFAAVSTRVTLAQEY